MTLNLNVTAQNKTVSANSTKMVQGVGASLHYRLGYKIRFSGAGDNTASKRCAHLATVKENGQHAHNFPVFVQLSHAVTELQAAIVLSQFIPLKRAECEKNTKLTTGFSAEHENAVLAFIYSHSQSAIDEATNALPEGINVIGGELH